jgi:D-alanyl-D-alanine carboxypeptidase
VRGYFVDPDTGAWLDVTETDPSIASGAGAIISTIDDVRLWIEAVGRGTLISAEMQTERLVMNPAGDGYDTYGFGLARIGEWIGHDGVFPGYQTAAFYDPALDQTIVILANSMSVTSDYHFPDAVVGQITPLLVPEPGTYALLLMSAVGFALFVRRRRRSKVS